MAKKMKKLMVLGLTLILCIMQIAVPALADDGAVAEPASEGLTVTTTTTTTDDGNGVITVTIEKTTEGTTDAGVKVEAEESKTTTTEGNTTTTEISGEEIRTEDIEDSGDEPGQPEVTVDLVPGATTEATADKTTVEGDAPADENDENYDYTETTVTERTVTAETSEIKTSYNEIESGLVGNQETEVKGLAPVYDVIDGVKEDKGGVFDYQYNNCLSNKYSNPETWVGENAMPEEADVRFLGTGEHTKYYAASVYAIYEKDEEGNTVYDENGKPVIKELWTYDPEVYGSSAKLVTLNGEPVTELPEDFYGMPEFDTYGGNRPTIHVLKDKSGNLLYAYCADNMVDTHNGNWYSMTNLEDSDYYASEDAEKHIRTIALNGYWGTSDIAKEDGTYETGSVEFLKQKLKDAINNGELENSVVDYTKKDKSGNVVLDENGNPITEQKTMLEIIDGLTAGEALIATQAAFWSYSNGSIAAQNGENGDIIIDPDHRANHKDGNSKSGEYLDDWGGARIDLLYDWLINLDTEEDSTIIINEKNFVEEVSLTVKDKDADHASNKDNNKDNDVYNTDINFKLAFVPGENDDLLVQISYTDLDGNNINVVRRLSGEAAEGETYGYINPDDNGNYVISGLKLSENDPFDFDLRLEGTQYLEQGVYIYECTAGTEDNQNFVGVAEGDRNVDISMGVTVSFDVDEDDHVVATRRWHSKNTQTQVAPINPNNPGGNVEINNEPVPLAAAMAIGVEDELVILDEEVPLAAAPQTGDNSIVYVLMSLISLCGIVLLSKKRSVA